MGKDLQLEKPVVPVDPAQDKVAAVRQKAKNALFQIRGGDAVVWTIYYMELSSANSTKLFSPKEIDQVLAVLMKEAIPKGEVKFSAWKDKALREKWIYQEGKLAGMTDLGRQQLDYWLQPKPVVQAPAPAAAVPAKAKVANKAEIAERNVTMEILLQMMANRTGMFSDEARVLALFVYNDMFNEVFGAGDKTNSNAEKINGRWWHTMESVGEDLSQLVSKGLLEVRDIDGAQHAAVSVVGNIKCMQYVSQMERLASRVARESLQPRYNLKG